MIRLTAGAQPGRPSSRYACAGQTGGVNLTKTESCHMGAGLNASRFYAETEGHPDETRVELALQELQRKLTCIGEQELSQARDHSLPP